ncbi:hypothetical protein LguiB_017998 [Lonicera macranthoides]
MIGGDYFYVLMNRNVEKSVELYLDKNQLTGQIPSSLWECRGLQLLSLAAHREHI